MFILNRLVRQVLSYLHGPDCQRAVRVAARRLHARACQRARLHAYARTRHFHYDTQASERFGRAHFQHCVAAPVRLEPLGTLLCRHIPWLLCRHRSTSAAHRRFSVVQRPRRGPLQAGQQPFSFDPRDPVQQPLPAFPPHSPRRTSMHVLVFGTGAPGRVSGRALAMAARRVWHTSRTAQSSPARLSLPATFWRQHCSQADALGASRCTYRADISQGICTRQPHRRVVSQPPAVEECGGHGGTRS